VDGGVRTGGAICGASGAASSSSASSAFSGVFACGVAVTAGALPWVGALGSKAVASRIAGSPD
jgi:hypothetical protein